MSGLRLSLPPARCGPARGPGRRVPEVWGPVAEGASQGLSGRSWRRGDLRAGHSARGWLRGRPTAAAAGAPPGSSPWGLPSPENTPRRGRRPIGTRLAPESLCPLFPLPPAWIQHCRARVPFQENKSTLGRARVFWRLVCVLGVCVGDLCVLDVCVRGVYVSVKGLCVLDVCICVRCASMLDVCVC